MKFCDSCSGIFRRNRRQLKVAQILSGSLDHLINLENWMYWKMDLIYWYFIDISPWCSFRYVELKFDHKYTSHLNLGRYYGLHIHFLVNFQGFVVNTSLLTLWSGCFALVWVSASLARTKDIGSDIVCLVGSPPTQARSEWQKNFNQ